MAEEFNNQALNEEISESGDVKDRGLFDFVHKKKEEEEVRIPHEEDVLVTAVEKINIDEDKKNEELKDEKKHGILHKIHRSHSSSSSNSSSDEEEVEGEGGIKEKIKKKKKALKDKLHGGDKKEPPFVPADVEETPAVIVEKVDVFEETVQPPEHEKKGFLDKIKEKLPGHGKKTVEEVPVIVVPPPPLPAVEVPVEHAKEHEAVEGIEGKEKKGFLGKIIEKLPGYHKNAGDEAEKSH